MLNYKKFEESLNGTKDEKMEVLKLHEEIEKNDVRKFLINCVESWEAAESWTEFSISEDEMNSIIISQKEAEEDWWVSKEFVDLIYNCENLLNRNQKIDFRNDLKDLIIKYHVTKETNRFTSYLNNEFVNKWEDTLKGVIWFRKKLNRVFQDN